MKTLLKLSASLVAAGAGAYLLGRQGFSFGEIMGNLEAIRLGPALLALSLVMIQVGFQVLRLWVLFRGKFNLSIRLIGHSYCLGQLVNNFLPARAGDLVKAGLVSQSPNGKGISFAGTTGVLIADKVLDVVSLFCFILITQNPMELGLTIPSIGDSSVYVVVLGIILVLALLAFVFRASSLFGKIVGFMRGALQGFLMAVRPGVLVLALLFSLGSWLSEALALQILTSGQGVSLTFSKASFGLVVLNLAIVVPITFANIGTFEASLAYGLARGGVAVPLAVALATVHHVIQITAIALGVIFFWVLSQVRRGVSMSKLDREFRVRNGDKERALQYFEKVSNTYDATVSRGILKYPRDLERRIVLELAALDKAGGTMIDVGCGAGFYALAAKNAGMKVSAVDASQGMVNRLKGQVDDVRVGDLENLSVESTYDRVVCAGVMDFVFRPELAFQNLCRLVAPHGRLVILAPRVGPGGLFYRIEKFFFGYKVNLYRLSWLCQIAQRHGLRLVRHAHPLPTNLAAAFERM